LPAFLFGMMERYFSRVEEMTSSNDLIIRRAYSRVGLMGNPGDAFGGAAVALTLSDLWAEATLSPSDRLRFIEPGIEVSDWESLHDFHQHIQDRGYYGGRRLMIALLERLIQYGRATGRPFKCPNFTLTWHSTIPNRVGLAGSSALLTASLRAILDYSQYSVSKLDQVDIVWKTEKENLGIPAGPQDRVAQVFEGLVFLEQGKNSDLKVESLDTKTLPTLFVAIDGSSGEGTEVFHSNLRERFLEGDPVVLQGLKELDGLAREARDLIKSGNGQQLGLLMDENFNIRQRLVHLNPRHSAMVERARQAGAHAKFAGSGGAIVGTCAKDQLGRVLEALRQHGYQVFPLTVKEAVQ